MTTVTIVSCAWGEHRRFVDRWAAAVRNLTRQPDDVIIAWNGAGLWKHRQAGLLDAAIRSAGTEWVWVLDIDDEALPTGLDGIDELGPEVDVWLTGYTTSEGRTYVPPRMTNAMYLAHPGNPYTGASAFRRQSYLNVGGFADVAFQDWSLWRRMAQEGCRFMPSGRPHFIYHSHDGTRRATELTPGMRAAHVREMEDAG
jgi:hypothetical protein